MGKENQRGIEKSKHGYIRRPQKRNKNKNKDKNNKLKKNTKKTKTQE